MMTKEKIQEELDDIKIRITALIERVEFMSRGLKLYPELSTRLEKLGFCSEEFSRFYLSLENEVMEDSVFFSPKMASLGNSFKTREDAEAAAKRNEIRADLLRNSKEFVEDRKNFTLLYVSPDDRFDAHLTELVRTTEPVFTKEKAQEMINKWGDDLKLLNV